MALLVAHTKLLEISCTGSYNISYYILHNLNMCKGAQKNHLIETNLFCAHKIFLVEK